MQAVLKVQEEVVTTTAAVDPLDQLDELEAMFEELEADGSGELVIEEPVAELSDDELEEVGIQASIEEARNEALAEMDEVGEPVDDAAGIATGSIEPTKPKRTAPSTKRITVAGVKKSEALSKALGAKLNDYLALTMQNAELPADDLKAVIDAKLGEIDALPIKIQEKVVNFYAHLSNGASLSNYTKIAVDILVKQGEITSKALRDAYIARPYSVGTANSQCTQLMKVLQVLELARKDGGKLVANPDSLLLPMLSA